MQQAPAEGVSMDLIGVMTTPAELVTDLMLIRSKG